MRTARMVFSVFLVILLLGYFPAMLRQAEADTPETTGLFRIWTLRETAEQDGMLFGKKYDTEYSDTFPPDFGSNPDYWNHGGSTLPYTPDKEVYIGKVGTAPGEICTIPVAGAAFHICVPEVPAALRQYADENGYSIIKVYCDGTPSENSRLVSETLTYVWFYTGEMAILPEYTPDDPRFPELKKTWRLDIYPPDAYLENSTVDVRLPFEFYSDALLCFGWYHSATSGSLRTSYSNFSMVYWGGSPFVPPENDTIAYTDTSVQMSDEEAEWFVGYMEQRNRYFGRPVTDLVSDPDFPNV